jgi:histidinol-phosphate aminotransferase
LLCGILQAVNIRLNKSRLKGVGNNMYYLDENIKDLVRIFDQNERKNYLRLDLNENPGGLPQDFLDSVMKKVTPQLVSQYPETLHFSEVLATHLQTDISHICITNGSAEAIRYIIQAFTSIGGKIVGVVPSYFMFQVYSEMYGRNFVKVPYNEDLSINIDNIISELTDDTQMLILLNPNNPMGNVYSGNEFERLFQICQEKEITLLIDEAYHYFYPKTFIKYALNNRRVLVTRTFSKLFSMAGCRLGYVVGHPEDIKYVQKFCTPHNTNAFAMLIAEEILTTPNMLEDLISKFNEGRSCLIKALDNNGYRHKGEAGNFLFIEPKTNAQNIVKRMKNEKNILIKSYPDVGEFGDCLRVSIGEKKYMVQFIEALLELDC